MRAQDRRHINDVDARDDHFAADRQLHSLQPQVEATAHRQAAKLSRTGFVGRGSALAEHKRSLQARVQKINERDIDLFAHPQGPPRWNGRHALTNTQHATGRFLYASSPDDLGCKSCLLRKQIGEGRHLMPINEAPPLLPWRLRAAEHGGRLFQALSCLSQCVWLSAWAC
jgi:hypothetical protein